MYVSLTLTPTREVSYGNRKDGFNISLIVQEEFQHSHVQFSPGLLGLQAIDPKMPVPAPSMSMGSLLKTLCARRRREAQDREKWV